MLTIHVSGPETGQPPLLIAHGLLGSARNWGAVTRRLSADRRVLAVDMRNHGDSFHADSHSYADLAADLAAVIAAHGGRADVLGHSMGGKAAMTLALGDPSRLRRLIVADIAPVAYGHSQRHLITAMRGLRLDDLASRTEADRRLAAAISDPQVRAFVLQSLDLRAEPPVWRLNLDALDAEMDRITGWEPVAGCFDGPTLFLAGARSDYLCAGHRAAIAPLFPKATFATVPDAGHWLHAENPRGFLAEVTAFLDRD